MLFIHPTNVNAHVFHCTSVSMFGDRVSLQTTQYSIHARYYFSKTQNVLNPWPRGIWIKNGGPAFHPVVYFILTLVLDNAVVTYKVLWRSFITKIKLNTLYPKSSGGLSVTRVPRGRCHMPHVARSRCDGLLVPRSTGSVQVSENNLAFLFLHQGTCLSYSVVVEWVLVVNRT